MPINEYSKKFFLSEFNLEDEFEKDKKAMGLEDDDEDVADRVSKNIGDLALKSSKDLKPIPTTKDLAAFYKNEKGYKYYIKDDKWRGIIVKNNKEFDVMKYPSTVEKLNKEFGTDIGIKKNAKDRSDKQAQSNISTEDYKQLDVVWTGEGNYNPSGIALIREEIEKNKNKYPVLHNPYFQVAIYSKIGVECYFTPRVEKNYKTVSVAKREFSSLKALTDEQVQALIDEPKEFWEYVYGLGQAVNVGGIDIPKKSSKNSLGNTKKGDGYKYRGRGYVQFTGRYQYGKYGRIAGVDGLNNPESFTDPVKAAKLAIPRIIAGVKIFGGGIKDYKDQDSANKAVTYSIAGSEPDSGAFERTASHNKNFKIVSLTENYKIKRKVNNVLPELNSINSFKKTNVIIDFTIPKCTLEVLKIASKLNKRVVIGTTGFTKKQEKMIKIYSKKIPILKAGNMSLGINLLMYLTEITSKSLGSNFLSKVFEVHHKHKKDHPSGTALMLGKGIAVGKNKDLNRLVGKKYLNKRSFPYGKKINFNSIRKGEVVGEHEVKFSSGKEIITLNHEAFDRALYSEGALTAAKWLIKKKPGLYSMRDVLNFK